MDYGMFVFIRSDSPQRWKIGSIITDIGVCSLKNLTDHSDDLTEVSQL